MHFPCTQPLSLLLSLLSQIIWSGSTTAGTQSSPKHWPTQTVRVSPGARDETTRVDEIAPRDDDDPCTTTDVEGDAATPLLRTTTPRAGNRKLGLVTKPVISRSGKCTMGCWSWRGTGSAITVPAGTSPSA